MNLETTLRLNALLTITVESIDASTVAGADALFAARAAKSVVEDHLLTLGWTNSPADVPAMEAASKWARSKVA